MRAYLMILPLALAATPALAQSAPPRSAPLAESMAIPPELSDPKLTDRLVDAMHVMTKAFLDLPVGEIEAALNGRPATAGDRRRTVRSEGQMTEQQLKREIEEARPMMHAGMRALMTSLPAMMRGMSEAAEQMERATANLPQPGYPKR